MRQETLSSSQESLSAGNGKIEKQKIFKIIVIGDSNVGKTCLTYRFCCGKFPVRAEATIGVDFREKVLHIGADTIKLQLWDTAGQERFRKSMIKHYYRNVHAVVFVYDMTKMSTFHSLDSWIEECNHNLSVTDIPKIIVGNKCDEHDHVVVSTNVAQQYADGHNMPHFETSAKCDSQSDHVEAIFMTLAHKLKDSKPLMRPPTIYKPESVIIQRSYHQTTSASASDSCGC